MEPSSRQAEVWPTCSPRTCPLSGDKIRKLELTANELQAREENFWIQAKRLRDELGSHSGEARGQSGPLPR